MQREVVIKTEFEDKPIEVDETGSEGDGPKVAKDITDRPKHAKSKVLERYRSTVRHILLHTNATPIRSKTGKGYSCSFCSQQYPDPKDLKIHTLEAHNAKEKSNFMKGKAFCLFYVKLDITNLRCTLCEQEMVTVEDILDHLSEAHKKMVLKEVNSHVLPFTFEADKLICFVCKNSVHNFRVLVEHMNIHYRNYICKECDAGFVTQSILDQHLRIHKIGSFKCDYCTKIFDTRVKKRAHERMIHTHSNASLHKCGHCSETFKDYWQREKHLSIKHGVTSVYKCQACDKTFQHQRGLWKHTKRNHLMERPHACTQCDKRFHVVNELKEHMVKHTGQRQFKCEICLKSYGRKTTLTEHMRVHGYFCKFKCKYCSQAFLHRKSCVRHMQSQHGNR